MNHIEFETITDDGIKLTIYETEDDYLFVQVDTDANAEIERRYYARDPEGLSRANRYVNDCLSGGGEFYFN